ncbi:MAG: DNA polymerase I [Phycisphaeraceae bacterium]|nr:DNA polymerase I [Phycisphaeraceae bacterium]
MARTLYLIDGHAQIFRAYHAIRTPLSSPVTGEPTHAVLGFANMLVKLLTQPPGAMAPEWVAMAIDTPGPNFRDALYDQYKAHRPPPPEDFHSQEKRILELCELMGIPILSDSSAEADDVIASVVEKVRVEPEWENADVRILSRDKDLEQLLRPGVVMLDIYTDTVMDEAWLLGEKGITPGQVIDVLALMGDAVDNVPGVPGIGPKTACQLVKEYGSIEGVYANIEKIKGKKAENLRASRELVALSQKLVTLKRDLPVDLTPQRAKLQAPDGGKLQRFFRDMGFRRLEAELPRLLAAMGGSMQKQAAPLPSAATATKSASKQAASTGGGSLFDGLAEPQAESSEAEQASTVRPISGLLHANPEDYRAITTREQLKELVKMLKGQAIIAVDTETIGLGHRAELCGLSIAWHRASDPHPNPLPGKGEGVEANPAVYVPVRSAQQDEHLDAATVLEALRPVFESEKPAKCGHNIKYDMLVLRHAGVELRGVTFDSMVAAHLLGLPGIGMDDLAASQLEYETIPITDLIGHGGRGSVQRTMDQVPLAQITTYAAEDADITLRLHDLFAPRIKTLGMSELAERVEMPLVRVLADMESAGVKVDAEELDRQKAGLSKRILELRDQIHEQAGRPFNPDSPKQLAEVLYTQLKLPVVKRTRTGPSTDVEALEKLLEIEDLTIAQRKIPELIVEYRQLAKLVGTYLEALKESIDPVTGRVHATFHQTGAATGRLSSSGPNLQNIPVRTEIGRQIRRAFVAEPGHSLISADYSQIELRLLAHLSGDPGLTRAFEKDLDIHAAVAAEVFSVPLEAVSKEQRGYAKTINFGIIYGVTAFGLARRIEGLDVPAAKTLIADYRRRFPGIDAFLQECIGQAESHGYVTTIMGRRRAIPEIRSANNNTRSLGERLAINSVVQGSAADLIKLAMVNLHRRIERERLPMKMILQIHDELVLEAPSGDAAGLAEVVREEMQNAMSLRVPLKADAGVGADWLAAK